MAYMHIMHHTAPGKSFTIRISRHMFKKLYKGKLARYYVKSMYGYRATAESIL